EIARSARGVIYASEYSLPADGGPSGAWLLRTGDAGATWTRNAIPISGPTPALLLAVHPADANTVFLRITSSTGDTLAVTNDGGRTFTNLLALPAAFAGFVLSSDGTLRVATIAGD